MKIAVLQFPGTNCETETKLILERIGLDTDIIRWNEDKKILCSYDGYVLPGGWSYEDRIRAGAIAARSDIMDLLKEQDKEGKPILGICNGCQVLIESGIVPKLGIENIEMALAPNINPKIDGFYCTWIRLRKNGNCAFTKGIEKDEVIEMPIAHAEGRFVTDNEEIIDDLLKNDQVIFTYCDEKGDIRDEFPINPNGSMLNIAGISNKKGNVLALMPHPERASFWKNHKKPLSSFEQGEELAPASKIFLSMKAYLEELK